MAQHKLQKYHLHLKGYVGGYAFDSDYVDYILAKYSLFLYMGMYILSISL